MRTGWLSRTMWRPTLGLLWPLVPLAACTSPGEPPATSADAGPDSSVPGPDVVEPLPPAAPAPPEPVRMTPCPQGWREVADGGDPDLVTCDPWPASGRESCAEDEAHFPGRPGCERIGPACPEGEWPEEIPQGKGEGARVLYVRAGGPEGGDGTRERPFGWIADAVSVAADGDVIALSKGLFDEAVRIDVAVTLVGACVLETRISPSSAGRELVALRIRAPAVVRDLQVGGAEWGIDVSRTGGTVELDSVLVQGAAALGIWAGINGQLHARDLLVRATLGDADGHFGYGLDVEQGAQVELERAALEGNRTLGLVTLGEDTSVTARDLVVAGTLTRETEGDFGYGLAAQEGARVELERAVLVENRTSGLVALGEGTSITGRDIVVKGTLGRGIDGDGGYGLDVDQGGRVDLERAVFEANRTVGLLASGEGSLLRARDLVVAGTLARESDGQFGYGLQVTLGARVELERASLQENRTVGLTASGEGSSVEARDLAVKGTLADHDGEFGYGLAAQVGALVELERVALEANRSIGLLAFVEGTSVAVRDLVVNGTLAHETDGEGGFGLDVGQGARLELERAALDGNVGIGILVSDEGTALRAGDVTVVGTLPRPSDGTTGVGMLVLGGTMDLARTRLSENRDYGLLAFGSDAVVTATDLLVERTDVRACASEDCGDKRGGFGIAADDGATMDVARFRSADNALAGALVARGAGLDLHLGMVSGNPIGANVQDDDYDLTRLQDDVLFVDNIRNSNRQSLPMPDPPTALPLE